MEDYTHWYRLEIQLIDSSNVLGYKNEENRTDDNAGYDCFCADTFTFTGIKSGILVPQGIKARLVRINSKTHKEQDSHYWLVPRSSIFKTGLHMSNSLGVIDRTYRGELKAPLFGDGTIMKGDRVVQIVAPDMGWIREVRIVETLPETTRGEGGFGSTGK